MAGAMGSARAPAAPSCHVALTGSTFLQPATPLRPSTRRSKRPQHTGSSRTHIAAAAAQNGLVGVRLVGSGSAVPTQVLSNEDLSQVVDTNDEWIRTRTGIRSRRILPETSTLAELATQSALQALSMANVTAEEVDMVILCTSTPDDLFGSACQIQTSIGAKNAVAFDLTAACSGFVLGLVTGSQYIQCGGYKNVLVVGADCLSRYVDWTDRGTCILFGDGSGAVLLQASEGDTGVIAFDLRSDGAGQRHLLAKYTVDGGQKINCTATVGKGKYANIHMSGQDVFKFAVRAVPDVVARALQKANMTADDIDWLLLHQANQRILDSAADKLKISREKVISNLANYGNTSSASIPLALDEAVRAGQVKAGDTLAIAGFGAGLSWCSAIVKWG
eukprot:jgi/Chlat1/5412/Chrsp35S05313